MSDRPNVVNIPVTEEEELLLIKEVNTCVGNVMSELGFGQPSKQLLRTVSYVVKETIAQLISATEDNQSE